MTKQKSENKDVLITGGAGYIGSHLVNLLEKQGYHVFIFDNLTSSVTNPKNQNFLKGDISNISDVEKVFKRRNFFAVFHLASLIETRASPGLFDRYYDVNVIGTLNVLDQMVKNNVRYLVFLSTCGVYGEQPQMVISEKVVPSPISIYAQTKYMAEKLIEFYRTNYKLKAMVLRLSNVAGIDRSLHLTNRMLSRGTIIFRSCLAAINKTVFILNGNSFKTKDGTCIRDYVDVRDVSRAQVTALEKMVSGENLKKFYNLGSGEGYSNLEILNIVKEISGKGIKTNLGLKVPGDIEKIVLDNSMFKKDFSWKPKFSKIDRIIGDVLFSYKEKK